MTTSKVSSEESVRGVVLKEEHLQEQLDTVQL